MSRTIVLLCFRASRLLSRLRQTSISLEQRPSPLSGPRTYPIKTDTKYRIKVFENSLPEEEDVIEELDTDPLSKTSLAREAERLWTAILSWRNDGEHERVYVGNAAYVNALKVSS